MRRLTLLDAHLAELRGLLFPDSGHENMAYVLCGRAGDERYLSHRVVPLPANKSDRHRRRTLRPIPRRFDGF